MNDNIKITYPEQLEDSDYEREYIRNTMTSPRTGKACPTGLAGYIVGGCTVVCHECVSNTDESGDGDGTANEPYPIFADGETDYPGHICDDCNRTLDTHLIVRRSQDPELFYRLMQAESLELDGCPSIPDIGDAARREAYQLGWDTVGPMGHGMYADDGEFADAELEPTRHGGYDTSILPKLRAIAGYGDRGYGTYQECYFDTASHILSEDVLEGYRAGYVDRAEGRDYGNRRR
jgi:hypothetical protein